MKIRHGYVSNSSSSSSILMSLSLFMGDNQLRKNKNKKNNPPVTIEDLNVIRECANNIQQKLVDMKSELGVLKSKSNDLKPAPINVKKEVVDQSCNSDVKNDTKFSMSGDVDIRFISDNILATNQHI